MPKIKYKKHYEREHGPKVKTQTYQCDICDKIYEDKYNFAKHRKYHIKTFCSECGLELPQNKLQCHILRQHTPEDKKPFVCPICVPVKGFVARNLFRDHMNIHDGLKPHVCKQCPNAAFANAANLAAHVRATHQNKKRKPKLKMTP